MGDRLETFVFEKNEKERLDVFLRSCLREFSRARLQGLIKNGYILVDGETVTKTGWDLQNGARIQVTIPPPMPSRLQAEKIPLDIIFENRDLLVVNKPSGMVVHPSPGHSSGTLVQAALGHDPDISGIGGEERPGIVHRLDKDTSGLIVIAKNDASHRFLQDQFRLRRVEKTYLALVDGVPPTPQGRVEAPIGRNTSHRKLMAVVPLSKGREAATNYRTLEKFGRYTFLELHPETGRTHQIRVHLAFLGCPVVGDTVYGKKHPSLDIHRYFLHAFRLKIILPGQLKEHAFEAPLPDDLLSILRDLRAHNKEE